MPCFASSIKASACRVYRIDNLAMTLLAARIGQTLVHVALPPTNKAASLRFALFAVQVVCMISMGGLTAAAMIHAAH
jgi:hypothetical protein